MDARPVALALLAAATLATGANLTPDAPYAHFKGKDQALFDEALYGVLDGTDESSARKWANKETGASGEVKAVKSFVRGETPCRTVSIANKAGGRMSSNRFNFCRSADGKWKFAQ